MRPALLRESISSRGESVQAQITEEFNAIIREVGLPRAAIVRLDKLFTLVREEFTILERRLDRAKHAEGDLEKIRGVLEESLRPTYNIFTSEDYDHPFDPYACGCCECLGCRDGEEDSP